MPNNKKKPKFKKPKVYPQTKPANSSNNAQQQQSKPSASEPEKPKAPPQQPQQQPNAKNNNKQQQSKSKNNNNAKPTTSNKNNKKGAQPPTKRTRTEAPHKEQEELLYTTPLPKNAYVCKNYKGEGVKPTCKKECVYAHIPENREYLTHCKGRHKNRICWCNPHNTAPAPFSPLPVSTSTTSSTTSAAAAAAAESNSKKQDKKKPVLMEYFGVFELEKETLMKQLSTLDDCHVEHKEANTYWLQFPLTKVTIHISLVPEEHSKQWRKQYIRDEEDEEEEDENENLKIEELDENGEVLKKNSKNKAELWGVLASQMHQACVLRWLEKHLDIIFIPPEKLVKDPIFNKCMLGVPAPDEEKGEYPHLFERIKDMAEFMEMGDDDFYDDEEDDDDYFFFGPGSHHFDMDEDDIEMMDDDDDEEYYDDEDDDEDEAHFKHKPSFKEFMMYQMMENLMGGGFAGGGGDDDDEYEDMDDDDEEDY